ncbi:F-box/FBD/LRR-repeat protein-like protein [Tanacetum coccineum]
MKASRLSSDIISSLPPIIKETILCLLPIQEAVRTSVLSKEWRYSWTKMPKLVFNDRKFRISTELNRLSVMEQTFHNLSERKTMSDKCKFFYAIYQVLLLHQGPILEFTLSMHGANYGCVEIDQMITHLSRKNTVTKLMLDLNNSYRLPLSIFSLQQLTDLTLTHCEIDHQPPSNGFASLTSLCLEGVDITKKTHLDLISSCPVLKRLELNASDDGSGCFGIDDKGAALIELLKCLHGVAQLTFGLWNFEKSVFPRELPTLLVHLKYVCLVHWSFIDKFWLHLLALLMRSSPNLEKIEIVHDTQFGVGEVYLGQITLAKEGEDNPNRSVTIVLMELQGDNEQTVTSQADLSPGPYVMTDMPLGIHNLLFFFVFPTYSCLIPDFFMLASDELVEIIGKVQRLPYAITQESRQTTTPVSDFSKL